MSEKSVSAAWDLLHSRIQEWVYNKGWDKLRPIQEEAIIKILDNSEDIIVTAATASGKTEAVFLPILSKILSKNYKGWSTICISPLKALINDQNLRLSDMLKDSNITLCPWHGDTSATLKAKVKQKPENCIIIITPESLEALLINNSEILNRIFQDLEFVVIDEFHSFLDSERGKQMQSLISRIQKYSSNRIRKIALSATIGNIEIAKKFLSNIPYEVYHIGDDSKKGKQILLSTFLKNESDESMEDFYKKEIVKTIFSKFNSGKNLIFANRREDVEYYTLNLNKLCEENKYSNNFLAHHGSLSKEVRLQTEEFLKNKDTIATILATSTLEMGIDIGSVKQVGQIGTPFSVAGLAQRIGRSGRGEGEFSVLRCYISEFKIDEKSNILDKLHTDLIQTIAIINLLIKGYYEDIEDGRLHLSTFIHQVLSFIAEKGGEKADIIFKALCINGVFKEISVDIFKNILQNLKKENLIKQDEEKFIMLDKVGEKLVNNYNFYSVFMSSEEYAAVYEGKTIGYISPDNVNLNERESQPIILGGKKWEIFEINHKAKTLLLKKTKQERSVRFSGESRDLDEKITEEMFRVYSSEEIYKYLDTKSVELLQNARKVFRENNLQEKKILSIENDCLIMPWRGTKISRTILLMLKSLGVETEKTSEVDFFFIKKKNTKEVIAILNSILQKNLEDNIFNSNFLASLVENKVSEKYDKFLPENIACINFASKFLNVEKARDMIRELLV